MIEHNQHIVSRVRWQTSLNEEKLATSLQSDLSQWNKVNIEKETVRVFDRFCPPEQVWRIQSLELDLGIIDYADLSSDLSKKFAAQLSEQLNDLLFFQGSGKSNMEIIGTELSHISNLKSYLLQGTMPWWYKSEHGSIRELLNHLLQNNQANLVKMIRQVGKSLDVRKRMAWQFGDEELVKIIEGLEPNNHRQITEFNNALTSIQEKETIVQTSTIDFRKQAWLWVLNHLLADRGTLFNKVAYMKSMLKQMAARFNISYDDLLALIEPAVEAVTISSTIQSDFLITLKMLSVENRAERNKRGDKRSEAKDYWDILETYLSGNKKDKRLTISEFNDLIITLSRRDKSQLFRWFKKIKGIPKKWSGLMKNLNEASHSTILLAFAPVQSDTLISNIKSLSNLLSGNQIRISGKTLWEISLDFLLEQKHRKFENKVHFNYLVNELAIQKKITTTELLDHLTEADAWYNMKSKMDIDLFRTLFSIHQEHLSEDNSRILPRRLNELLEKLCHMDLHDKNLADQYNPLHQSLIKCIQSNPQIAFRTMHDYKDQERLQELLSCILENHHARLIIEKSNSKSAGILITLQSALNDLRGNHELARLIEIIDEQLMLTGLQIMLARPGLTGLKFLEAVLDQISQMMSVQHLVEFGDVLHHLFGHDKSIAAGISKSAIADIKNRFDIKSKQGFVSRVCSLIGIGELNELEIADMLLMNLDEPDFASARSSATSNAKIILDYFLPNGSSIMSSLIIDSQRKLSLEERGSGQLNQQHELSELYWKSILSFRDHKGSEQAFRDLLIKVIAYKYELNTNIIKEDQQAQDKTIKLKSGDEIPLSKLHHIISQGLEDARTTVDVDQKQFQLTECLQLGLEMDAKSIEKLFTKIQITDKRIENLLVCISLGKLCYLMPPNPRLKSFFGAMRSLYDLIERLGSQSLLSKLLVGFWKQTWLAIQTTRMDDRAFSRLVEKAVFELAREREIDAATIVKEIKSKQVSINDKLNEVLVLQNNAFSILSDIEKTNTSNIDLDKCVHLGLLDQLTTDLLLKGQVPAWFSGDDHYSPADLLNEIIKHNALVFLKTLRHVVSTENQRLWIAKSADATLLLNEMKKLHPNLSNRLESLEKLYLAFNQFSAENVSGRSLQHILLDKILSAWSTNNWQLLSSENLWKELMWEVCTKRGIKTRQFLSTMDKHKASFPSAIQIALSLLINSSEKEVLIEDENEAAEIVDLVKTEKPAIIKEGIPVKNAGLVLLADYIKMLFDRLGILSENKFSSPENQLKAIHYLQYVVSGFTSTEESLLALNKVICGLHPSEPITSGIEISESEKELIHGLINAVIGYWSAIGNTTIDGFRGNWLVRDGMLGEHEENWDLTIDKRAYDLLIHKSPFAFSIIKYPWMNKPLHVKWPY